MKIIIEDYNPAWPLTYQKLKTIYESFLGELIMDVQHFGSTSVEGLAAKPIIDIDLIIEDEKKLQPVIEKLALLGYDYLGDLGITERYAFKRQSEMTPVGDTSVTWPDHNLYVCPENSISLRNHLVFRDFLRVNPGKVKVYSELKKKLARENPYNLDLYVELKTPFITGVLQNAGFNDQVLQVIAKENKSA